MFSTVLVAALGFATQPISRPLLPAARGIRCCAQSTLDELTMDNVRSMFRDVRGHYRGTKTVDEVSVCRNMMVTRVKDFRGRIARCEVRPSTIHGDGLYASRNIAEGELVTFVPGDSLLVWEDGDRSSDVMMFFGGHVPQSERDAKVILGERVEMYEQYVTGRFSLVGDPSKRADPAYLGHFANDGARCLSPTGKADYERKSTLATNADPVWVEGCHVALQARQSIRAGEEILVSYGAGHWLSRGGGGGVGADIRVLGTALPSHRGADTSLQRTLQSARPKKQAKKPTKAGEKAKLRKAAAARQKSSAARGFGAPPAPRSR